MSETAGVSAKAEVPKPPAPKVANVMTSSMSDTPEKESKESLPEYVTSKWQGSIFAGWYTERVHVDDLKAYRDRVVIDLTETEVIKKAKSTLRRVKKGATNPNMFIGLQKTEDTCALLLDWTGQNQPFGHFWFYVESAQFSPLLGIRWKLRVVRSVLESDTRSSEKCPHCDKFPTGEVDPAKSAQADPLSMSDVAKELSAYICDNVRPADWLREARPYLTFNNFVDLGRFLVILTMAMVSGAVNLLPKVIETLNKTIHEAAFFMHKATPFLMGVLNMVNNCIRGFFMLIAMIWRDFRKPPQPDAAETRKNFLEGPRYPYRREVQRPYLQNQSRFQ